MPAESESPADSDSPADSESPAVTRCWSEPPGGSAGGPGARVPGGRLLGASLGASAGVDSSDSGSDSMSEAGGVPPVSRESGGIERPAPRRAEAAAPARLPGGRKLPAGDLASSSFAGFRPRRPLSGARGGG